MRRAVRLGMLGGAATVYLTFVGLLDRFTDVNLVGHVLTLSFVILVLPAAVAAWVATGPRVEGGQIVTPRTAAAARDGLVTGLLTGVGGGLTVLAIDLIGPERIRQVFLPITVHLVDFMTVGVTPVVLGALCLIGVTGAAGLVAGVLRVTPTPVRKPVLTALAAVLLFGALQRIIPFAFDQLNIERGWLYSEVTRGLTWLGAIILAVLGAGLSFLRGRYGTAIQTRISRRPDGRPPPGRVVSLILAAAFLLAVPQIFGKDVSQVLGTVGVFALLAIGLNIIVGYAGMLHLGFVFFFAFGAYTTALLTGATLNLFTGSSEPAFALNLNFYAAIPIVMLLAAGAGALMGAPVLRLRGDYLALVTLAIGQAITVLVASRWWEPVVGGPAGMRDVTDAAIGTVSFRDPQNFVYLAMAFIVFALFVSWRLVNSRIGRGWTAMREDEQIAEAMGVSIVRYKLLAFAVGGAIGSLGGALFAVKIGSLTPASFEVLVSIQVLGIVILGGIGSLPGVIVGALVLVGLPGLLREFEEYRLLVYGGALVAIMILRPQGLVPNVRRMRELQDEEKAQDDWQRIFETEATPGGEAAAAGPEGPAGEPA